MSPVNSVRVEMLGKGGVATPSGEKDIPARRRRWYLGIQSKKDPAHVMNEVYKAVQSLGCVWNQVNNYRVLCLWTHTPNAGTVPSSFYKNQKTDETVKTPYVKKAPNTVYKGGPDPESGEMELAGVNSFLDLQALDSSNDSNQGVKIALSLYKVQQSIYLLDFQRIDGDIFGFLKLCALIITELKNLSAASRGQMSVQTNVNPG